MLSRIFKVVNDHLFYPRNLIQLLYSSQHDVRTIIGDLKSNIYAESVEKWHELSASNNAVVCRSTERNILNGWRSTGRYYESFQIICPEYEEICHLEVNPTWECDISDIHGFSASKSNLRNFATTDELVETNCREMVSEVTLEKLAHNLAHREIRLIHSPLGDCGDYFTRYLWDGRLWLMNSGGSHHTAAAKYIATRLKQRVLLRGKLYTYSLNTQAISSLKRQFDMFIINNSAEVFNAFFEAMQSFKASWLWHPMPPPYNRKARAILFPRDQIRSARVAAEFRKAGIFDLGKYLTLLAEKQNFSERERVKL